MLNNFSNLEITKTKRDIELINSDDHGRVIKSMKKSLEEYRPDVAHQVNLKKFEFVIIFFKFLQSAYFHFLIHP